MEVWLMEEYGGVESRIKIVVIEARLFLNCPVEIYNTCVLENGDILLHSSSDRLFLYNPRRKCHLELDAQGVQSALPSKLCLTQRCGVR
ncbi:hypothetical protein D5086_018484 [Populus alba]|uniref:Uncharacterized protein n=1 Tax=Populus alba TaxID=43335 RepID=A0ACC4BPX1_POPAL